jgi:hypothetical protein
MAVPEAAEALGISEDAVQRRIKRKTLETAHEGSRVFVVLGDDDRPTDRARPSQPPGDRDELVDEMRARIAYLERPVEEGRETAFPTWRPRRSHQKPLRATPSAWLR